MKKMLTEFFAFHVHYCYLDTSNEHIYSYLRWCELYSYMCNTGGLCHSEKQGYKKAWLYPYI